MAEKQLPRVLGYHDVEDGAADQRYLPCAPAR